jgi:hypothetical protein
MGKFKIENGTSLDEAVGITVGAGSMCWENVRGAGEFQSTEAAAIVQELLDAIRDGRVRDGQFAVKPSRWQPLDAHGQPLPQRSPGPDLGDDPDGDVAGYDGGFTPTVHTHDLREVDGG